MDFEQNIVADISKDDGEFLKFVYELLKEDPEQIHAKSMLNVP